MRSYFHIDINNRYRIFFIQSNLIDKLSPCPIITGKVTEYTISKNIREYPFTYYISTLVHE